MIQILTFNFLNFNEVSKILSFRKNLIFSTSEKPF